MVDLGSLTGPDYHLGGFFIAHIEAKNPRWPPKNMVFHIRLQIVQ